MGTLKTVLTPLVGCLALLAVLAPATAQSNADPETRDTDSRPNIVLIMADDLGSGDLGFLGSERIRTPNIDRLAANGVRINHFYAGAPVCAPTRAVLMTGKSLYRSPVRDNREVQPEGQHPLPAGEVTIAETLRGAGYRTGVWGKWGLGPPETEGEPLAQGFDHFFGYNCQRDAHTYYPPFLYDGDERIDLPNTHPRYFRLEQTPEDWSVASDKVWAPQLIADDMVSWVRQHAGGNEPLFVYYATVIPHLALQAPAEWVNLYPREWDEQGYLGDRGYSAVERPRATYAAMVSFFDHSVGRLIEALREAGELDNTLIIVTSDNGGTFDLGGFDPEFFRTNGDLRGAKGAVFEGGLRVPFIASWPGVLEPGRVRDARAAHHDLHATLAEVGRAQAPADSDGVSLWGLLRQGEPLPRRVLFWEFPGYRGQQAIIDGDLKAVRRNLHNDGDAPVMLFDLATDPNETTDLAETRPEDAKRLLDLMMQMREPHPLWRIRGLDPAPGGARPD